MKISHLLDKIYDQNYQGDLKQVIEDLYCKLDSKHQELLCDSLKAVAYQIPLEKARKIVQSMTPFSEKWSYEAVKDYLLTKGIPPNQNIHYYLAMNMAYNDYYKTAEAFGQKDNPEFYFSIARDFIEDPDAGKLKVEMYFNHKD